MPRLLILCEYHTLLGGERSMLSTLPAIQVAGFDVLAAAPPAGPLADVLRRLDVPQVALQVRDGANVRRPLVQLREELAQLFKRVRPDVVHANSLSMARVAGPAAVAAGVKSFGHLRDIVKLSGQAVDDLNCHRRLIAVSRATRDFHVQQGVEAGKCAVVHNGVDLTQFRPRAATGYVRRELGLPAGVRFVATVGQISLRKGTDVALEAAKSVFAELPDVHWLVVGERTSHKDESREFEDRVRAMAAKPPLAGRVHFLGTRNDVPELFGECELFIHAARQEPLGRVLLEAAASGMPVVATDVGGTREIFATESDGAVLVAADDPIDLAAAVVALLRDDARRQSMGCAARRRAETAFDVQSASARLIEQYCADL